MPFRKRKQGKTQTERKKDYVKKHFESRTNLRAPGAVDFRPLPDQDGGTSDDCGDFDFLSNRE